MKPILITLIIIFGCTTIETPIQDYKETGFEITVIDHFMYIRIEDNLKYLDESLTAYHVTTPIECNLVAIGLLPGNNLFEMQGIIFNVKLKYNGRNSG